MASEAEDAVDYQGIEEDLEVEFEEFLPRETGAAHEVSSDKDEAVYAGFAPGAEE